MLCNLFIIRQIGMFRVILTHNPGLYTLALCRLVFKVVSVQCFSAFRAENLVLIDYITTVIAAVCTLCLFLFVSVILCFHANTLFLGDYYLFAFFSLLYLPMAA